MQSQHWEWISPGPGTGALASGLYGRLFSLYQGLGRPRRFRALRVADIAIVFSPGEGLIIASLYGRLVFRRSLCKHSVIALGILGTIDVEGGIHVEPEGRPPRAIGEHLLGAIAEPKRDQRIEVAEQARLRQSRALGQIHPPVLAARPFGEGLPVRVSTIGQHQQNDLLERLFEFLLVGPGDSFPAHGRTCLQGRSARAEACGKVEQRACPGQSRASRRDDISRA